MAIAFNLIKKDISWLVFYFIIASFIGIFMRDLMGQPDLFVTIVDFQSNKYGDPNSFVKGALDIYHYGWFSEKNQWLINLWPPGFMVLEGVIVTVFGINAPFILILIILNSIFIAWMLLIFRKYLSTIVPLKIAALLPLILFCFPVTRIFLLQPEGIVFGEAFSIVFFLISLLLALLASKNNSWSNAILAGSFLALSAYFRSQFELIVMFFTLLGLCLCIFMFIKKNQIGRLNIIKTLLIIIVTANVLMLPWRIYNHFSWVQTSDLVYKNAGHTDEELYALGGGFLVAGGENLACKLEPSYCGKADKLAFYNVFFQHPLGWYEGKINIFPRYWFSPIGSFGSPGDEITLFDKIINGLLLCCVLAIFPLLWLARRYPDAMMYFWMCASFFACFLAVFTFVHFEVRYFFAVKIFTVFITIILASAAWRVSKNAE